MRNHLELRHTQRALLLLLAAHLGQVLGQALLALRERLLARRRPDLLEPGALELTQLGIERMQLLRHHGVLRRRPYRTSEQRIWMVSGGGQCRIRVARPCRPRVVACGGVCVRVHACVGAAYMHA